jgi:hypothetical protein
MSATSLVIMREVRERKLFLGAALAVSLMPIGAAQLPAFRGWGVGDVVHIGGFSLAMLLMILGSVLIGSSIAATDLIERRMSFWFARPFSTHAIWGGKFAAALLLLLGAALLAMLPATLIGRGVIEVVGHPAQRPYAIVAVLALPLLVLLSHHLALSLRSRSPWLLLDLAAIGGFALLVWWILHRLYVLRAISLAFAVGAVILTAAGVAFYSAALYGISRGRASTDVVHRSSSIVLAILLALLGISSAVGHRWLMNPSPSSLNVVWVHALSPSGTWIAIGGHARLRSDYPAMLLVNAANGRSFNITPGATAIAFSPGGDRVAWMEPEMSAKSWRLVWARLGESVEATNATTINVAGPVEQIALDDSNVAIASGQTLSLFELASERQIASFRLGGRIKDLRMADGHATSITTSLTNDPDTKRYEYEVAIHRPDERTSEVLGRFDARWVLPSRRGEYFVSRPDTRALEIRSTKDGSLQRRFEAGGDGRVRWILPREDEHLLVTTENEAGHTRLELHDGSGSVIRRIDFGVPSTAVSDLGGDHVVISQRWEAESSIGDRRRLIRLNIRTGETRPIGNDLSAAWLAGASGPTSLHIVTGKNALFRYDESTASLTRIAGRP